MRLRTPSCWPLPPLGESVLASVVQHTVWPARLTHHHGGTQAVRLATVMEEAKRHGIALPHGTPSTLATHKRMKCVILAETLHVVHDDVGNRKLVRKGPPPKQIRKGPTINGKYLYTFRESWELVFT